MNLCDMFIRNISRWWISDIFLMFASKQGITFHEIVSMKCPSVEYLKMSSAAI